MEYKPARPFEIFISYDVNNWEEKISDVTIEQIKHEILYLKKHYFNVYITLLEAIKKKCNTNNRKILLMNVINNFKHFSPFPCNMLVDAHHLNHLYVANSSLHKIYFRFPLSINDSRHVYAGEDEKNKFVIKWISHEKKSVKYEMKVLELLKQHHVKLYAFDCGYTFWDEPVLCMEKLTKLDGSENENNVGRQILRILKKIHEFGVHCDIKPDNIMKKNNEYYLIDFGGFSIKKLKHGYHRKCWSTNWTSQDRLPNQVTTYKNDLIELTYTLNAIRLSKQKVKYSHEDTKRISPENKKIYNYYKIVLSINDVKNDYEKIKPIYDKLIKIFS